MPIIIFFILVALVASFGFGDTLQAIVGAIGVVIVLVLLFALLIAATATWLLRR
jgi:hypothetical protein